MISMPKHKLYYHYYSYFKQFQTFILLVFYNNLSFYIMKILSSFPINTHKMFKREKKDLISKITGISHLNKSPYSISQKTITNSRLKKKYFEDFNLKKKV